MMELPWRVSLGRATPFTSMMFVPIPFPLVHHVDFHEGEFFYAPNQQNSDDEFPTVNQALGRPRVIDCYRTPSPLAFITP